MPKKTLSIFLLVISVTLTSNNSILAQQFDANSPHEIIHKSITAVGGVDKLTALKAITIKAIQHVNGLEQSERPEGPYLRYYAEIIEVRDLRKKWIKQNVRNRSFLVPNWGREITTLFDRKTVAMKFGERVGPGNPALAYEFEEQMAASPENVLINASKSHNLHKGRDTELQGIGHYVVSFTETGNRQVKIFINKNTFLMTAVEVTGANPFDHFWGIWGDLTSRYYYSFWALEDGGIRYPVQTDLVRNGLPVRTSTITEIRFNEAIAEDEFTIPENVYNAFIRTVKQNIEELPLGNPNKGMEKIAEGLYQITGRWNIGIVKQKDGLVILEAPISSGYSAKLLHKIRQEFPGMKIKAVISTSDAWPHIGGLREYTAAGIPIYTHYLNKPIIERLISSSYSQNPDNLEKNRRKLKMKTVSRKTVIGKGEDILEIYPVSGEGSERMLMVYFPASKFLYGSDLIQFAGRAKKNFFFLQYPAELLDAVHKANIKVNTVFAMHSEPIQWERVVLAVTNKLKEKIK